MLTSAKIAKAIILFLDFLIFSRTLKGIRKLLDDEMPRCLIRDIESQLEL